MTFKLTRNDIIALEWRKNMDIDNALRLDFGPELILLCTRKFEKKTEIVSKDRKNTPGYSQSRACADNLQAQSRCGDVFTKQDYTSKEFFCMPLIAEKFLISEVGTYQF